MRIYLFIYYKINALDSKTVINVHVWSAWLFIQPHPIKIKTLEKSKIDQEKRNISK